MELGPVLHEDVFQATVVPRDGREGKDAVAVYEVAAGGKRETRPVLVAVNGVLSLGTSARLLLVRAKEVGVGVRSSEAEEKHLWLPRAGLKAVLRTLTEPPADGSAPAPPSAGPRFLQRWVRGEHLRRDEWSRALTWLLGHLVVYSTVSSSAKERAEQEQRQSPLPSSPTRNQSKYKLRLGVARTAWTVLVLPQPLNEASSDLLWHHLQAAASRDADSGNDPANSQGGGGNDRGAHSWIDMGQAESDLWHARRTDAWRQYMRRTREPALRRLADALRSGYWELTTIQAGIVVGGGKDSDGDNGNNVDDFDKEVAGNDNDDDDDDDGNSRGVIPLFFYYD